MVDNNTRLTRTVRAVSFRMRGHGALSQIITMLPYPEIDPVAIALGPVQVHWYGLAYLAGIGIGW